MSSVYQWHRPQTLRSSLVPLFLSRPNSVLQPVRSLVLLALPSKCLWNLTTFITSITTSGVQSTVISHLDVAGVSTLVSLPPTLVVSHLPSLVPTVYSLEMAF